MLSSGMITPPFFVFPENFTHSFHIYSVHGTVSREQIWTTKQNWGTHTVEDLHWIVRVYVFGILIRTGSWSLTWSWSVLDSNTDWILIRIGSGSGFSRVRRDVYQEGHKGRPQKNERKIHLSKSWKPGEVSCNWDFFQLYFFLFSIFQSHNS